MKDIAIYGAGGFGREIACVLKRINKETPTWNLIGFFDDVNDKGSHNEYGEILGGINDLNQWNKELNVLIAIATSSARKDLFEKIKNEKIEFPNLLYAFSCADTENYSLGKGNIVLDTFFSCNVTIGDFNVFNGGDVLGHDVSMESYNTVMPGTRISGNVSIGDTNFFGVGAIILQKLKIGNGVRVGAGSVLMRNAKDNYLYIGNPAKKFEY